MIVALHGKRIYFWLLSFNKVKAGILYFLMTAIPAILAYVAVGVTFYHSYSGAFIHGIFLFIPLFADAVFGGIFFKETEIEKLKKRQELLAKGLTPDDISNIAFVKYWESKRHTGRLKYIIINGLFAGCMLFLPVSFLLYPHSEATINPFLNLSDMLLFIAKFICLGIALGINFNILTWYLNERQFKRLTAVI